ncbi:MAG: cytochrome c [Flavobacteriales bacterium]|nr:cytochrome c [Flavobacteriales bacterium]
MKKVNKIVSLTLATVMATLVLQSCGAEGNHPGYEFMPNMYRSAYYDTYTENPIFENGITSQLPVQGTIPRGFVPFEYENTLEDYLKAGRALKNPIALNDKVLDEGKQLYQMFCQHCHGADGDGKGSISHPVYGGIPSYTDEVAPRRTGSSMSELKSGHIFHALTYGLNAMGPHASQLSKEERWKIVHYVHELQKGSN